MRVPIWLLSVCLLLLCAPAAQARVEGACYPKAAAKYEQSAKRAYVRAASRYREAQRVHKATDLYAQRYGSTVGRWVRLARHVGWPWGTIPNLMYIINRESGGGPGAVNPSSGCTGLLQILPSNVSQPQRLSEPEYNLSSGLKLFREAGWSPWAL